MSVSDELLDVVNDNDEVIAVQRRADIHARGLMHRAVHILLFNSRGELFLQKRSMSKDEQPGKWDSSAAGHVDSGEDYLDCAHREIGEELGVVADTPLQALFKLPASMCTGNEHCMVYQYCFDGPLVLQADEVLTCLQVGVVLDHCQQPSESRPETLLGNLDLPDCTAGGGRLSAQTAESADHLSPRLGDR